MAHTRQSQISWRRLIALALSRSTLTVVTTDFFLALRYGCSILDIEHAVYDDINKQYIIDDPKYIEKITIFENDPSAIQSLNANDIELIFNNIIINFDIGQQINFHNLLCSAVDDRFKFIRICVNSLETIDS